MPQLFGTGASTAIVVVGMLLVFDWRLALASLWPVPVAADRASGSRRACRRAAHARRRTRRLSCVADGMQEYLECIAGDPRR